MLSSGDKRSGLVTDWQATSVCGTWLLWSGNSKWHQHRLCFTALLLWLISFNYLHEQAVVQITSVQCRPTDVNLADMLTKIKSRFCLFHYFVLFRWNALVQVMAGRNFQWPAASQFGYSTEAIWGWESHAMILRGQLQFFGANLKSVWLTSRT